MCQKLNCLPKAGGLYDQDPDDVTHMRWVMELQAIKAKEKRG